MITLYIKTLFITLLIIVLSATVFHFRFVLMTKASTKEVNAILTKGIFYDIQAVLSKTPMNQWDEALKELNKIAKRPITIKKISDIDFTEQEKNQLLANKTVSTSGKRQIFLNNVIPTNTAYQRISNTDYVIQLSEGALMHDTVMSTTQPMMNFILWQLKNAVGEEQKTKLAQLQQRYEVPLTIYAKDSAEISADIKTRLNTQPMTYAEPTTGELITTLYYNLPDTHNILKVGPLEYMQLSRRITDTQLHHLYLFLFISIIAVLILTWFFSRNIRKIYKITKNYSQGNFTQTTSIHPFSVLNGVYNNITRMGDNLKQLIKSQQNMAQFVAHEIRTPLYTIQLASEQLNAVEDLPSETQQYLESIKEDITDMNNLVSQFLLYSQSTRHELKLKKQPLDIINWLEKIIQRHSHATIHVSFQHPGLQSLQVSFDPTLLKHVIDNLIINALKFAKSSINISIQIDEQKLMIHIDDDGPGIAQEDRNEIFNAFATLDQHELFSKHIGLGLYIAKTITEMHSASLTVSESSLLGGSSFTIAMLMN